MTEEQKYTVEKKFPEFELRRYDPCVVAEVVVSSTFESAGNLGFRPLVAYISGSNRPRSTIAMTAPVIQVPTSTIAMTAPVTQEVSGNDNIIGFVMPANMTLDSLPQPTNPAVSLRSIPEQLVAVMRFSGTWSEERCSRQLEKLQGLVARHGFRRVAPPRFARFNPPWTPWFLRRNEIQLPVEMES